MSSPVFEHGCIYTIILVAINILLFARRSFSTSSSLLFPFLLSLSPLLPSPLYSLLLYTNLMMFTFIILEWIRGKCVRMSKESPYLFLQHFILIVAAPFLSPTHNSLASVFLLLSHLAFS